MTEKSLELDLATTRSLLRAVDDALPDGPEIAIRVDGGVGVMSINPTRVTQDVDMFEPRYSDDLRQAILVVAKHNDLPESWMNNDPALFGGIDVDVFDVAREPLFRGRRLVVYIFDLPALLALKILASRDRDTDDITLLMHKTGLTTPRQLRQLLRDYFDHQPQLQAELNWAYLNVQDLRLREIVGFGCVGRCVGHDVTRIPRAA